MRRLRSNRVIRLDCTAVGVCPGRGSTLTCGLCGGDYLAAADAADAAGQSGGDGIADDRIVGGNQAPSKQYCFLARVSVLPPSGDEADRAPSCSGTILTPN